MVLVLGWEVEEGEQRFAKCAVLLCEDARAWPTDLVVRHAPVRRARHNQHY